MELGDGGVDGYVNQERNVLDLWAKKFGVRFNIIESNTIPGSKNVRAKYDFQIELISSNISLWKSRLLNPILKIEVKIDELDWVGKTGNIGFDYISAFNFKESLNASQWKDGWVAPDKLQKFKDEITISTPGKLFKSEADLQIFAVMTYDPEKNNKPRHPLFLECMLTEDFQSLRSYFERELSLRINNKSIYATKGDTWKSASYLANLYDKEVTLRWLPHNELVSSLNYSQLKRIITCSK